MFLDIFKSHGHMSEKDLLLQILQNQHLMQGQIALEFHYLKSKIEQLMTKAEFIQSITDLKTEVGTVSTKVDALEQKINNSPTDVDPEIVAAFQDLKGSVDTLSTKADNAPASLPVETPPADGGTQA